MVKLSIIACAFAVAGLASSKSFPAPSGTPTGDLPGGLAKGSGRPFPSGASHPSGSGYHHHPSGVAQASGFGGKNRPKHSGGAHPSGHHAHETGIPHSAVISGLVPSGTTPPFFSGTPSESSPTGIEKRRESHHPHFSVHPSGAKPTGPPPSGFPKSGFAHPSGFGHGHHPSGFTPSDLKPTESPSSHAFSSPIPTGTPSGIERRQENSFPAPSGSPPPMPSNIHPSGSPPSGFPHHHSGFAHHSGVKPTGLPSGPAKAFGDAHKSDHSNSSGFPTGGRPSGPFPTGRPPSGAFSMPAPTGFVTKRRL